MSPILHKHHILTCCTFTGLQQNRIAENNTTLSQKLQSNLKFGIILLIVIIIGIGTITYLLLDKYAKQSNDKQILFGNNYETGTCKFSNLLIQFSLFMIKLILQV